jgi:pyruvate/2-oxoglutarate dehydrogenase complex dihydrolipoamide dehydrogenase (E3) component
MSEHYDAIIVGAGQSGPPLAERLGRAGHKTAIVERHRVGGTCVNVGCIPTKTLVGSARVAYAARQAAEFGETRGFIKILVDADTEEILGASILGLSGDEVVHCLLDVMYAGKPYTVIARAVHIHPTVSELIPTVLQGLAPLE